MSKVPETETARKIANLQAELRQLLDQKRSFEIQRTDAEEGERITDKRLRAVEAQLAGVGLGQQFQRDYDAANTKA